jgi:hypothetical protein
VIFLFDKDIAIKFLSFLLGNPVRLNAPLPYPQFDRFKFKDFRSRLNWTALTFQNVTKAGSLDRKQLKMNKMATSNQFPSRAAVLGTSPPFFFLCFIYSIYLFFLSSCFLPLAPVATGYFCGGIIPPISTQPTKFHVSYNGQCRWLCGSIFCIVIEYSVNATLRVL